MDRKAFFLADSMVSGFLATALEDLQHTEEDRACMDDREPVDVGTIYDCPDATFWRAVAECAAFRAKAPADLIATAEKSLGRIQLGSDLYLERTGSGVGFRDRSYIADDDGETGDRLADIAESRSTLDIYVGDDGKAYFA